MRTAPAVGVLEAESLPEHDYAVSWVVKTPRGKGIPVPKSRGIATSIEALELALRDGWTFLGFRDMVPYLTKHVELHTIHFVREGESWEVYPRFLKDFDVPKDATPEEIRDFALHSGWNMTGENLVFERLGNPVESSERSRM